MLRKFKWFLLIIFMISVVFLAVVFMNLNAGPVKLNLLNFHYFETHIGELFIWSFILGGLSGWASSSFYFARLKLRIRSEKRKNEKYEKELNILRTSTLKDTA